MARTPQALSVFKFIISQQRRWVLREVSPLAQGHPGASSEPRTRSLGWAGFPRKASAGPPRGVRSLWPSAPTPLRARPRPRRPRRPAAAELPEPRSAGREEDDARRARPGEPALGSLRPQPWACASRPPASQRGGWSRHPRGRRGGRRQRLGAQRRRRQKLGSAARGGRSGPPGRLAPSPRAAGPCGH